MANKNKKKASAPSAINGVVYSNGCSQKNGSRDSDEDQNPDKHTFIRTSGTTIPISNPPEDLSAVHIAHEPTASCSAESQTEFPCSFPRCTKSPEDGLINFIKLSPWSRVETICELVKVLSPQELRLLGACLEGAVRPSVGQLKWQEKNANNPEFISHCLNDGRWSYPVAVKETFDLICLLNSTNRKTAYAYVKLIDQLMADRRIQLSLLPEDVRLNTLQDLGKLITAALNHPAFSVDQCMRFEQARDELLMQYERIRPVTETGAPEITNISTLTYIKKIVATAPKEAHGTDFGIELQWADGQVTWVTRTRKEICSLQHRLLDAFGNERGDESANSSTVSSPAPQQTLAPSNSSRRLIPYFNNEMSNAEIVEYLNGLSDLPARMMLSSVMYEEFHVSRQKSHEDTGERNTSRSPSLSSRRIPITSPQTFLVSTAPLSYNNTHNERHLQVSSPSCSNCAGDHSFVQCPKKSIMEMSQAGKDGFRLGINSPPEDPEGLIRHTVGLPYPPGLAVPTAAAYAAGPAANAMLFNGPEVFFPTPVVYMNIPPQPGQQ